MNFFLEVIRNNTDYVLCAIIWLVILLIYVLRQKRKLEQEILRKSREDDDELSRQSKGRLTSLDAMVQPEVEAAGPHHSSGPFPGNQSFKSSPPPGAGSPHIAGTATASAVTGAPGSGPASGSGRGPAAATAHPASSPAPVPSTATTPAGASSGQSAEEAALLTQYASGDGGGVEEMERMLEQDPNNLQLLDWLAFMYYSNNDIPKAIATYSRIIEIEPNNASQHYYLGNCFYKNNQKEKALAEWNTVIALKPNSKYARKAQERIAKLGTVR